MISLAGRDILHAWGKFLFTGIGLGLLRASGIGEALLLEHVASQARVPLKLLDDAIKQRGSVRVMPLAHCFCTPLQ